MAMGMAGFSGRMWSSAEEATVGTGEPEKRCREKCRMERVWDERGCGGRWAMGCQVAVGAILWVGDRMFSGRDPDCQARRWPGRVRVPPHCPRRRAPIAFLPTLTIRSLMFRHSFPKLYKEGKLSQLHQSRLSKTICIHLNYPENLVGLEGRLKHGFAWDIWLDGFIGRVLDAAKIGGREAFWNAGDKITWVGLSGRLLECANLEQHAEIHKITRPI